MTSDAHAQIRAWTKRTVLRIESGEAHYMSFHVDEFFDNYDYTRALDTGHTAFQIIVDELVALGSSSHLGARLAFALDSTPALNTAAPDLESWGPDQLDGYTPPGLYVHRVDASLFEPSHEDYRRPLKQQLHKPTAGKLLAWFSSQRVGLGEYVNSVYFDYLAPTAFHNQALREGASGLPPEPDRPSLGASDGWLNSLPPLVRAAAWGRLTEVSQLLKHGLDPNQCDEDGWSALHAAATRGHSEVVRVLLDAGAHADAIDDSGRTPLEAASGPGNAESVALLLSAGADPHHVGPDPKFSALTNAADYGNVEAIRLLLGAGMDVNEIRGGLTPLMFAAQGDNKEAVEVLLTAGADPSIRSQDSLGETAYDLAVQAREHENAELIHSWAVLRNGPTTNS